MATASLRRVPVALAALVALAAAVGATGCRSRPWANPPDELLGRPWQNARQPTPDAYPDPAQTTAAGLDAAFGNNPNPTPPPVQTETRPLNVLALSAGGKYSVYAAGLLGGWTASGTRPQFDVVTGVSAGALLAVYAFLGPQYDARAEEKFVNISRRDLFRLRPVRGLIAGTSLASTKPFAELIAEELNDDVVAEIARAHCAGRRLFVATGNRTSLRLAIWDLGAIAASGRPDAPELVRKIVLAAASHPGFAPAVEFDVTVNGVHYRELHGDAGNLTQAFVRTANGLPPGSNVYVVSAGKYYRDPLAEKPRPIPTVAVAASNTLYALFRADAANIFALCAVTKSRFHLIATPPPVKASPGSLAFDPEDQRLLFAVGYKQGLNGTDWRSTPPGSQPDEVLVPRTGLDFVALPPCPVPPQP
jgi:hypothetical protein